MIRIIMSGCNGKMGQTISGIAAEDEEADIVAGFDIVDNKENEYPVFTDIEKYNIDADVVIDFSSTKGTDRLLEYCLYK
ncbi:MAG: 4-hydroxy-tetrahydrodipicolinate reductase, partial [Lachnospiraceae bacterium]|nr:4-hydroxy-tetrahydrodipicolinate reductase [Lachnospiraceae bacterium]